MAEKLEEMQSPPAKQGDKFKVGAFVLLKKLNIGPRALHKAKAIYHSSVFRIIRRTETNAVLIPFGISFLRKRYKSEGDIPKSLCFLQKISNLRPIRNPYKFLRLSFNQK